MKYKNKLNFINVYKTFISQIFLFHKKNQFIKMCHVQVLKSTVYSYHSIKVEIIKRLPEKKLTT